MNTVIKLEVYKVLRVSLLVDQPLMFKEVVYTVCVSFCGYSFSKL